MTDDELKQAADAAEQDERQARSALERVATANARLARALNASRGKEATDPTPFDMAEIYRIASERTGMTVDALKEAGATLPLPDTEVVPYRDPRATARGRAKRAGAPELHIRNVVDVDPVRGDAFVAVESFLADPALGLLVLSGGKGTHKTGSACWALSQRDGEYVEAVDLFAIAVEDKARFLRLRSASLVVLDELGGEVADDKGYWQRTFNTLWNGWYSNCAKVIATCNLTAEQFKAGYGERAFDRLRERGRFFVVGGESLRKRPA